MNNFTALQFPFQRESGTLKFRDSPQSLLAVAGPKTLQISSKYSVFGSMQPRDKADQTDLSSVKFMGAGMSEAREFVVDRSLYDGTGTALYG